MKKTRLFSSLFLSLCLSGCGTISGIVMDGLFRPYTGVEKDITVATTSSRKPLSTLRRLVLFDLPFSFVIDTVLLPATIPVDIFYYQDKYHSSWDDQ